MTRVHRLPYGEWWDCDDAACELPFHLTDMTAEAADALPERLLWPLLEVLDPPTFIAPTGAVRYWRDAEYRYHRDYDLPAEINSSGAVLYYQHGIVHRGGDRPAVIGYEGTQEWYRQGKKHRGFGRPASISPNGYMEWWEEGCFIRSKGVEG